MSKQKQVQIRLTDTEKQSFEMCADIAGIPLAAWMRERLRVTAQDELEMAGMKAPFMDELIQRFKSDV